MVTEPDQLSARTAASSSVTRRSAALDRELLRMVYISEGAETRHRKFRSMYFCQSSHGIAGC